MIRIRRRRPASGLLVAIPRPPGPRLRTEYIRAHRHPDGGCIDNTMLPGWCVDCGRQMDSGRNATGHGEQGHRTLTMHAHDGGTESKGGAD